MAMKELHHSRAPGETSLALVNLFEIFGGGGVLWHKHTPVQVNTQIQPKQSRILRG